MLVGKSWGWIQVGSGCDLVHIESVQLSNAEVLSSIFTKDRDMGRFRDHLKLHLWYHSPLATLIFNARFDSTPGSVDTEVGLQPGVMINMIEDQEVQATVRTMLHGFGVSSDPVSLSCNQ